MTIPSLTFARITTPGGPYRPGDLVSIAFDEPTVGRLLSHAILDVEPRGDSHRAGLAPAAAMVPESVSAVIITSAIPYDAGDAITLSFVDPSVARIHPAGPTPGRRSAAPLESLATIPDRSTTPAALRSEHLHAIASPFSHEATAIVSAALLENGTPPLGVHAPVQQADANGVAVSSESSPKVLREARPVPEEDDAVERSRRDLLAPIFDAPAIGNDAPSERSPLPAPQPLRSGEARTAAADVTPGPKRATTPTTGQETAIDRLRPVAVLSTRSESLRAATVESDSITTVTPRAEPASSTESADGQRPAPQLADVCEPDAYALRLAWPAERAGRFVQVVDKLFTVDRLGWYRHVLATRLLVADEIVCVSDGPRRGASHSAATASLRLIRSAGLEALGAPLLAAYLPGFTVSRDWLATLNGHALPSALETLCEDLGSELGLEDAEPAPMRASLVGSCSRDSLITPYRRGTSMDAMLPRLMPTTAVDLDLSRALGRYRDALLELFAQIAPAPSAVRVRQMAQPNPVLDDRLWHVVGAVQQTLVSQEAATGA